LGATLEKKKCDEIRAETELIKKSERKKKERTYETGLEREKH